MSALSTLRTQTRRLIQETTAGRWTDAVVDGAINNRYYEAQDRLNSIRPGYFDTGALLNLVSGTLNYARPFFKPVRHYYRLASDGSTYIECELYSFDTVQPDAEHNLSRIVTPGVYAVAEMGPIISVYPTPTSNQTAGLKVLSDFAISLSDDADIPRLKPELHHLLTYGAAAELLDDDPTYPEAARAKLQARWDYIFLPEVESLKRLARIYPYRNMGRLSMEPPTLTTNARYRRLLNNGTTIIY